MVDVHYWNELAIWFGEKYNDQKPITLDEFTFLYDKLIEATSYASRITIENMKKETNEIASKCQKHKK